MEITLEEKPAVVTATNVAGDISFNEVTNEVATIEEQNPQLASQADELVAKLLDVSTRDIENQEKYSDAIQTIGSGVQKELMKRSKLLNAPMTVLMKDAEDGGKVANGLDSLQVNINEINPNRVDFSMGTVRRLFAKLPGVGTPLSNWFAKYQTINGVIDDIVKGLEDGKAQLLRDNTTLRDDQRRMRALTFQLEDFIQFAFILDNRLESAVASLAPDQQDKRKFLEEELLFNLKQRIVDLQQQQAVNQQGVVSSEVIIRNNKELIKGVDRTLAVTLTALNTAATLQVALQRQKKTLKGLQASKEVTQDLLVGNAKQLKENGAAIQKQASSAMLDTDVLKQVFADVQGALDDISTFRREALPAMAESIVEMDQITGKMEESIKAMEQGNKASKEFAIELQPAGDSE